MSEYACTTIILKFLERLEAYKPYFIYGPYLSLRPNIPDHSLTISKFLKTLAVLLLPRGLQFTRNLRWFHRSIQSVKGSRYITVAYIFSVAVFRHFFVVPTGYVALFNPHRIFFSLYLRLSYRVSTARLLSTILTESGA